MKSAEDISRLSLAAKRELAAELLRKKVEESKSAYPLSKGQQALWFQHQLAPAAYNVTFAARILGDLNVEALRGSFEKLVERHALLRTDFGTVDGRPLQRVTAGGSLDFRFVEMSSRDQAEIDRAIGEEARCPFDLERGGLLRVRLFSRAPEENILLLTIHHIIGDFWSLVILIEELRLLYPGEKLGRRSHLPRLDCEYRDYVKWQESLITGSRGEELWEYWRKELAGDLQQLEIPIDKPRPPVQTYRGASYIFSLGSELTSRIKALAIQADVTPYVVLLAAFNLLLHRYTGQQDIFIGSIATGRSHPQFESVFGYFANPLVLRSDLSGNPSFLELCERVRRKVLGAVENEDYPFPLLVERLKPIREASSSPIFNTMFLFEKAHRFETQGAALFIMGRAGARISLDDLVLESINLEQQAVQFDLTLMMEEANGVFTGSLQYNEDLFEEERIERMGEHLRRVLEEVGKNGELRIGSVKYLSEGEEERLVREWNETRREYGEESVQEMIEREVRERGDAVAVRCGEEQLSYREMNERGNKLGRMLRRRGVREESLVGICVERSVEMMVGLIGIMKSGGAYIPIDPGFPVERVEYMLEDGKAEVIVTEKRLASVVRGGGRKLVLIDEEWEEIEREGGEDFGVVGREENLMYVMYTSGSTGRPKGVGIERGSVTNLLKTMKERPGMGEEEVMVAVTTISFDIAGLELYLPLIGGGQVVVMRREEATDVEELKEGIRKNGATIMQGTPATWRMLVEGGWEGEEGLKVLCGGEALGEELAGELKRRGLELWNMYGPTETTIWSAIEEVEEGRGIGIGRPIGNTEIYLLDEYGELCGEGIAGEMYIGGKGVGRGYIGRGDLTGERFVPDGVSGGEGKRMYRTGDVCRYREGGRIEYEGRRDEQVKVRGYRIEIGEVERVLEEDERVSKAVVVLRESEAGGKHLVAYIVPRAEHSFSNARLRDSLRQRLPEYMLPAAFVPIDELPLTPNGKINRRALPVPDRNSIRSEEFVGPRSPEEELLAAIWSQLLGISRIGVDESFFALGGHSLLATQLVSRIEEVFHLRIPLATVFEAPTIARMADRLQSLSGSGALVRSAPIERCSRSEELPLSFAQQRLWFLDQFERGSPFYNVPAAFQLTGRVNVPALEASLSEIVRRHESLRTVFEAAGGRPVQTITPARPIELHQIDLSSLGAHERRSWSESLSSRHARRVFDLARGPLLRVCLLKLAAEEHVLLINIHHIVFDGWSAGIFVREISSVHEAARGGWACSLPEPLLQCADFAAWQRQWLKGEVLDSQLDYWKKQLRGDLPPLELPTDHPRPPVMTYRGARKSFLLSAELTESLEALSRKRGVTLFMTLLAGFLSLLHRYTGQLDIRVGSSIANRNRGELEGIIGFFVNTIVLRAGFSGNPSFAELLNEVRRAALEAYANQDLPFERLVEELHPERDLGRSPIFQAMYIHQNAPAPPLTLSELAVSQTEVDSGTSMFDLTLFTEKTADGISGSLQYNEDLFEEERIERMGEHLRRVLEEVGKNGELRIGSVKYLSEGEEERLVREWNETRREYGEESVQEMIEREVRERGDAVAVRCGEEQLSYREMNERGNKLGRMLRRRGVREESLVGICVERSVEMMVGLIGIMKSGGAYIPIDPGFPVERVEYMLEDGKAEVIVTEKRLASVVRGGGRKLVLIDEEWEEIEREGGEDFGVVGREENLMYVMYTSGSTGRPKGVGIERGSVTNLLKTMKERPGMGEEEVMVAVTTISFDIAGLELYLPLIGGGQVVVMRREEATDVEELKEGIRKNGATIMQGTPATWRMLVEGGWEGEEGLKVLCGGEALGEELAGELKRRGLELWNMYGPTETTIWSAIEEVEEGRGIGIGRPIGNTEIYLLDEYGELCGEGIAGEMYIGGKGVGRGYIGRGDLTGERFVPDGVSGGEGKRMYRTGDVCRYREGGRIEYEGRRDEQVKVRGYRIEIGEVERVLEEDERVSKAVVVLRESEAGGKHLVAYIVPNRHYLGSQQEDTSRAEQIDHTAQWQGLWDDTYSQAPPHPDHTFNTSGWNSSYTGAPIAADEMREWVDSTVARILALGPRAALEVGCGTGLLLFRIAPHCDRYVGTDFSETAIGYIARELSELEQPPPSNISVMLKSADGLGDFEERSFDTVILNSVVQYFPGVDYLVQVLRQAVDLVESGGAVFLGDVRNLTLLEPFHASVLASQSPKSLSASELKRRLRTRVAQEEELLLDPQFFMALRPQLPRVSRVEIQLKRGRNLNELTQFRYDVVLHIGASEERPSEGATLDWIDDRCELSTLRDCLEKTQPRSLTVTQIPNGRISDAVRLIELLGREGPPATVGELAEALESSDCRNDVEPEDIWQLCEELPYGVEVRWSRSGNPGCFDALFTRRAPGCAAESSQGEHRFIRYKPLSAYANNPLSGRLSRKLVPEMRSRLKAKLPDYMIPSTFELLDSLPLTPNGKVDRRALPDTRTAESTRADIRPKSGLEQTIAAVWQQVLQLDSVSVNANFFDLGGHSLSMAQVRSRLRDEFNIDLSMVELFRYPTINSLSKYLTGNNGEQPDLAARTATAATGRSVGRDSQIAIIGMAGRFPGAENVPRFWENIRTGVESITFFSDRDLLSNGVSNATLNDSNYVKAGSVLDGVEMFDARFFGFNAREAEFLDPQHRVLLECASEALDDAGYDPNTYSGAIGVFAGASLNTYLFNLLPEDGLASSPDAFQILIGNDKDYLATRISYKLNLHGPSVSVQTACSTSLVAVHLGCQSLLSGESDMVLAGGVSVRTPQMRGYFYEAGGVLSPDGHCRAFDAKAAGTVFGSGAGIVVLKMLEKAIADGDHIYAVLKGSAINNDGALKAGYTAPNVDFQAAAIRKALNAAGVDPATIGYVETHGTGTALGDPIEIAALTQAFSGASPGKQFCAIGSVKSNIGHLDAAAGVAGLIKTALALNQGVLPPSLNFEDPNPQIDFDEGPFYVNTTSTHWKTDQGPRRAGVSSFGIGGTNAHVILEEPPQAAKSAEPDSAQLILISARTGSALESLTGRLAGHLKQHRNLNLADIAYTLQAGRRPFQHRRMVLCRTIDEAVAALETRDPTRMLTRHLEHSELSAVFLFPGQGSQYPNMGRGLYTTCPAFRNHIDACSETLRDYAGVDLRTILYPEGREIQSAENSLGQTSVTQPVLFVVEYALAKLLEEWGVRPRAMAGHSIGEYVAACLSGVFSLEDALRVVAARGRLMQSLPPGAMLSVYLSEDALAEFLNPELSLAAVNSPSMSVASGPTEAIEELEARLKDKNVDCRRLPVSHAFHSGMMDPIVAEFARAVRQITLNSPMIPYLSNVTGQWISADEATSPDYWATHLRREVRFGAGAAELLKLPNAVFLEVGPGKSLLAAVKQQSDKKALLPAIPLMRHFRDNSNDIDVLSKALGLLWLEGVQPDWRAVHSPERRRRVSLPGYPFERQRYWIEPPGRSSRVVRAQCDVADSRRDSAIQSSGARYDVSGEGANQRANALHERPLLSTAYRPPASRLEAALVEIWQDLLGISPVGIHDDFFDLGGHSLLAARVMSRVREVFQVDLTVPVIFEASTVEQMLMRIAEKQMESLEYSEVARILEEARGPREDATPEPNSYTVSRFSS